MNTTNFYSCALVLKDFTAVISRVASSLDDANVMNIDPDQLKYLLLKEWIMTSRIKDVCIYVFPSYIQPFDFTVELNVNGDPYPMFSVTFHLRT